MRQPTEDGAAHGGYGPGMNVLVGTDASPHRHDAVALGSALATALGGDLHVAHVLPGSANARVYGADLLGTLRQAGQEILDSAAAGAPEGLTVHTHLLEDDSPARALHALAVSEQADVLVLGSSHRGRLGRALLGGTAERVVQGSPCAVAVAPHGYAAPRELRHIGIAYDAGPESRAALRWASDVTIALDGSLHVLTVAEPLNTGLYPSAEVILREDMRTSLLTSRQRDLDQAVGEAPPRAKARGDLLEGVPSKVLAAAAEDLDLLVLGSREYGPLGAVFLGGVSHGLLRDAPCPVVVLPRSVSAGDDAASSEASPPAAA